MEDGLILSMNSNGVWGIKEEPFTVVECQTEEDYNALVNAIEKQTSKKAIERHFKDMDCGELYEEGSTYHCPDCGNEVGATSLTFEGASWQTNYCCDCGQKLKWN